MNKKLLKNVLLTKHQQKGIRLYEEGKVKDAGFNQWKIRSLEKTHNIHFNHGKWTCTCPNHQYQDHTCKHIHATRIYCRYTTHPTPKLTFTEMVELEKQLYPHPIQNIEAKIRNMKTIIPEMMEVTY